MSDPGVVRDGLELGEGAMQWQDKESVERVVPEATLEDHEEQAESWRGSSPHATGSGERHNSASS
jgi:hypothetical protein